MKQNSAAIMLQQGSLETSEIEQGVLSLPRRMCIALSLRSSLLERELLSR